MPAYILVKAQDGFTNTDPMTYQAGYPVDVLGIPRLVGLQVPPKFIQIVITDAAVGQVMAYCEVWMRAIDWEFVGHDYVQDGHRIRAFTRPELVSASGLNALTREQVESFLNLWNASVYSIARNEVVFDALVAQAMSSQGFWNRDVSLVQFTEKSYNSTSGVHEIEANYSGMAGVNPDNLRELIAMRACTVTKDVPNKITYSCQRDTVFEAFKQDVKNRIDRPFARKKWYFTRDAIDLALANGGSLELTQQQALAYLHNRLLD